MKWFLYYEPELPANGVSVTVAFGFLILTWVSKRLEWSVAKDSAEVLSLFLHLLYQTYNFLRGFLRQALQLQ